MKPVLFSIIACLALVGCNGATESGQRIPARSARLAALGWEESSQPITFSDLNIKVTRALFCKTARCGGPGGYMIGNGSLLPNTAFGHIIAMYQNSPESETALVTQRIQGSTNGQNTLGFNIESVKRHGKTIDISANGPSSLPDGSSGVLIFHLTVDGDEVRLQASAGKNRAAAQAMFKVGHSI